MMLLLMKAFHRWIDGVTFGFGHGGIEAILLVGLTMVSNPTLAVLINPCLLYTSPSPRDRTRYRMQSSA